MVWTPQAAVGVDAEPRAVTALASGRGPLTPPAPQVLWDGAVPGRRAEEGAAAAAPAALPPFPRGECPGAPVRPAAQPGFPAMVGWGPGRTPVLAVLVLGRGAQSGPRVRVGRGPLCCAPCSPPTCAVCSRSARAQRASCTRWCSPTATPWTPTSWTRSWLCSAARPGERALPARRAAPRATGASQACRCPPLARTVPQEPGGRGRRGCQPAPPRRWGHLGQWWVEWSLSSPAGHCLPAGGAWDAVVSVRRWVLPTRMGQG